MNSAELFSHDSLGPVCQGCGRPATRTVAEGAHLARLLAFRLLLRALALLTTAAAPASDLPQAFTQPASQVRAFEATLNGTVVPGGPATLVWFEWGTNSSFAQATPAQDVGGGDATIAVSARLAGLEPAIPFHYRLVASNSFGTVWSAEQMFGLGWTVVAWGDNSYGERAVPPGLHDVVAIAAGSQHSLALRSDGMVVAWGDNRDGQGNVPPSMSDGVAVSAGWAHSLALRADGSVAAWGANAYGQTNVPPDLSSVVAVAAGGEFNLALRRDGTVAAWGRNDLGQINVPGGLSNVVAVAAGYSHCLALRSDGRVVAWGDNQYSKATVPSWLSNVVAVAAGSHHSLALRSNGTAVAWGGFPSFGSMAPPAGLSNVIAIASHGVHSLALLRDGRVAAWGYNGWGATNVPVGLSNVVAVAGGMHSLALVATPIPPFATTRPATGATGAEATLTAFVTPNWHDTTAWFDWSSDRDFGNSTPAMNVGNGGRPVHITQKLSLLDPTRVYHYRVVASNCLGVVRGVERLVGVGRKVAAWGDNTYGQTTVPAGLSNIVGVAAGRLHSLALRSDGTVTGWGKPGLGAAVVPSGLSNVIAVAAGLGHSVALQNDGTVVAWGDNGYGQTNVPTGLSNVVAVAAGQVHSLALRSDGRVVAWGDNMRGQTNLAPYLDSVVSLACDWLASVVVLSDGTLAVFGSYQRKATTLTNVAAVGPDGGVLLALLNDGTIASDPTYEAAACPAGPSNMVAVARLDHANVALRTDGTLFAWLKVGSGPTNIPPGLNEVVAITPGGFHGLALGGNVPPLAQSLAVTLYPNYDSAITLPAFEPNGDPVTIRITSLPSVGALYQCEAGGRGALISVPGTTISDPLLRVIFSPPPDALGSPLATFSFVASDGEADSPEATVTVNVVAPAAPWFDATGSSWSTNGALTLSFIGSSNATYRAWGSTNLMDWVLLGPAGAASPGLYRFVDTSATNWPQRFYRVVAP